MEDDIGIVGLSYHEGLQEIESYYADITSPNLVHGQQVQSEDPQSGNEDTQNVPTEDNVTQPFDDIGHLPDALSFQHNSLPGAETQVDSASHLCTPPTSFVPDHSQRCRLLDTAAVEMLHLPVHCGDQAGDAVIQQSKRDPIPSSGGSKSEMHSEMRVEEEGEEPSRRDSLPKPFPLFAKGTHMIARPPSSSRTERDLDAIATNSARVAVTQQVETVCCDGEDDELASNEFDAQVNDITMLQIAEKGDTAHASTKRPRESSSPHVSASSMGRERMFPENRPPSKKYKAANGENPPSPLPKPDSSSSGPLPPNNLSEPANISTVGQYQGNSQESDSSLTDLSFEQLCSSPSLANRTIKQQSVDAGSPEADCSNSEILPQAATASREDKTQNSQLDQLQARSDSVLDDGEDPSDDKKDHSYGTRSPTKPGQSAKATKTARAKRNQSETGKLSVANTTNTKPTKITKSKKKEPNSRLSLEVANSVMKGLSSAYVPPKTRAGAEAEKNANARPSAAAKKRHSMK